MTGLLAGLAFGALCLWRGYTWGHRQGTETASARAVIALEAERARCRDIQMTQVFGPRGERIVRPQYAECN